MNDAFLQSLVLMANSQEAGFETGITLNVNGVVVSGVLIGVNKYFELFKQQFGGFAGNGGVIMDTVINGFISNLNQDEKEGSDEKEDSVPQIIHLKNAKFYTPGNTPIPIGPGVLWRGRLDSINGFTIGSLG